MIWIRFWLLLLLSFIVMIWLWGHCLIILLYVRISIIANWKYIHKKNQFKFKLRQKPGRKLFICSSSNYYAMRFRFSHTQTHTHTQMMDKNWAFELHTHTPTQLLIRLSFSGRKMKRNSEWYCVYVDGCVRREKKEEEVRSMKRQNMLNQDYCQ